MLLVLPWFGACQPTPQLQRLQPNSEILALGDSLTLGTGVAPESAYPAVLSELTGLTVINAGIAGEETAQAVQRLPVLLQRYQPELVIVIHGGNDLLRQRDEDAIKYNLATLIERIQASGSESILVSLPEPGLLLRPASLYNAVAQEYGIPVERQILTDLLGDPRMKSDPVHLNEPGYRRLAEAILAKMKDSGAL